MKNYMKLIKCLLLVGLINYTAYSTEKTKKVNNSWRYKTACQVPGPQLKSASYSPDGKYYVSVSDDVMLFDVKNRAFLTVIPTGFMSRPIATAFTNHGKLMAILSVNIETNVMEVIILNFPDIKILKVFSTLKVIDTNVVKRIVFSPDSKKIAVSNKNGIAVYDIDTGNKCWSWIPDNKTNPNSCYSAFDVTPDWKAFLFKLQRIDYPSKQATEACVWSKKEHFFRLNVISADGKKAYATGGMNATVLKIFDLETGKVLKETKNQNGSEILYLHPSGEMLISDQYIYNIPQDSFINCRPYTNFHMNNALAHNPQTDELSIGNIYFKIAEAAKLQKNKGDGQWMQENCTGIRINAVWAPDSKHIFLTSNMLKKTIILATGKNSSLKFNEPFRSSWVQQSPSRKYAVQRSTLIYPDKSKKPSVKFSSENVKLDFMPEAVFSNDDNLAIVVTAGFAIFQLPDTECKISHPITMKHIANLALSNKGKYLALTAMEKGKDSLLVYDVKTGKTIINKKTNLSRHNYQLAFSNDSTVLYVGIGKMISRIQMPSGKSLKPIILPTGGVKKMLISIDGKNLMIANTNGNVEIIDTQSNKFIRLIVPGTLCDDFDVYSGDGSSIYVNKIDISVPFNENISYKTYKLPQKSVAGVVIEYIKAATINDIAKMKTMTGPNNYGGEYPESRHKYVIKKARRLKDFDSIKFTVEPPVKNRYKVDIYAKWNGKTMRKRTFYVKGQGGEFVIVDN